MKRLAMVGASLVLVGGMTAACGGSPDDADKGDFCDAMMELASVGEDKDKFEDARDKIKDVGTPKEIDGDAREGFEVFVDALDDVDTDNLDKVEDPDLDSDDEKKFEAFQNKFIEVCMDEFGGGMTDDAPQDPSEEGTE